MIASRDRNIVIKSQFNIGGSRGKSVKGFISDYVSRDSACDASTSYVPDRMKVPVQGDGVGFTLNATAIDRDEVLRLADHVEELFLEGNRAIQQMVVSFDHEYLVLQGVVDPDVVIRKKSDYQYNYDDVRLRHAIREGVQSLVDLEGYRDAQMVGAIQHDTTHLHAHLVVYEDYPKLARTRGREEKGVIKESSFHQMAYDIDRSLTNTKSVSVSEKKLFPNRKKKEEPKVEVRIPDNQFDVWMAYANIMYERMLEREALINSLQASVDIDEVDIDDVLNNEDENKV